MMSNHQTDSSGRKAALEEQDDKLDSDMVILDTLLDARLASELGIRQTVRQNKNAILYAALACCGVMSEGYQMVLQSALPVNVGFVSNMGIDGLGAGKGRALDPLHVAAWSGAYSAAYILALMLAWWPVERSGSRTILYAAQVCLGIACTIEVLARNWSAWLASKILFGVAAGLTQCAAIHYVVDISPTKIRGALLCLYPFMYALGQLCGTVAVQVMILTSPLRYRRILYAQYLFIGIAVAGLGLLPESPRGLTTRGKYLPARIALQRLHPRDDQDSNQARLEVILSEVESVRGQTRLRHVIQSPNLRRVLISSFGLVWQKWLGPSLVLGYGAYFFQLAGVIEPFTGSIIISTIVLVGVGLSGYFVEKVGRRRLMLFGGGMMITLVLIVGAVLSVPLTSGTGAGLVSLACLWTAVFSTSVSPIAIVYLGETSSDHLRAKTISLAASGAAFLNLVVDYCIPLALNNQHFDLSYAAWLFGCTGVAGLVVCFFHLPDLTNRPVPYLDKVFDDRTPARWFPSQCDTTQRPGLVSQDP